MSEHIRITLNTGNSLLYNSEDEIMLIDKEFNCTKAGLARPGKYFLLTSPDDLPTGNETKSFKIAKIVGVELQDLPF